MLNNKYYGYFFFFSWNHTADGKLSIHIDKMFIYLNLFNIQILKPV